MIDNQTDPFINWINRWRSRLEQAVIFLMLVLHLTLMVLLAFSVLVQHASEIKNNLDKVAPQTQPSNKDTH